LTQVREMDIYLVKFPIVWLLFDSRPSVRLELSWPLLVERNLLV